MFPGCLVWQTQYTERAYVMWQARAAQTQALRYMERRLFTTVPAAPAVPVQVPHLSQQEALSIQYRKQQPSRSSAIAPFSCSKPGSRRGSEAAGGGSSSSSRGGSEAGGSEAGGSEEVCSVAGGSGNGSGGGEASGVSPASSPTPQLMSGGRALVVKNLPPSLPYEAVRVFFSQ